MRIISLLLIFYLSSSTIGYSIQYGSNAIGANESSSLRGDELFSPNEFELLDTKASDALAFHLYEDHDRFELPELQSVSVEESSHELNHTKLKSLDVLIKSHSYSIPSDYTEKRAVNYFAKAGEDGASLPKLFPSFSKKETIFLPLGLFVVIKKKF